MSLNQSSGNLMSPHTGRENIRFQRLMLWAMPALVSLMVILVIIVAYQSSAKDSALWPWQQLLFLDLNQEFSALPAAAWTVLTLLGDTSIVMLLLVPFLLYRPQAWAALLASVPAGGVLSWTIKQWADVPRPPAVLSDFHLIGPALQLHSFPSGHTITAFAAAASVLATLAWSSRQGGAWLQVVIGVGVLTASLVGLSRIALGVHWPFDVAVGAALGWLAGLSGALIVRHMGWWTWVFLYTGRRPVGLGLMIWGVLLWFRAHSTTIDMLVNGFAGVIGIAVGLVLCFGKPPRQLSESA